MSDAQALSNYMTNPAVPPEVRRGYETLLANYRHLIAEADEHDAVTGAIARDLHNVKARNDALIDNLLNSLMDLEGEARDAGVYDVIEDQIKAVLDIVKADGT